MAHQLRNFSKLIGIWNVSVFVCTILQIRPKTEIRLAGARFVQMVGFPPESKSDTALFWHLRHRIKISASKAFLLEWAWPLDFWTCLWSQSRRCNKRTNVFQSVITGDTCSPQHVAVCPHTPVSVPWNWFMLEPYWHAVFIPDHEIMPKISHRLTNNKQKKRADGLRWHTWRQYTTQFSASSYSTSNTDTSWTRCDQLLIQINTCNAHFYIWQFFVNSRHVGASEKDTLCFLA